MRDREKYFRHETCLDTADVTFDYNVLYTGAVVTDAEYNILHAQTLSLAVVHACYERFTKEPGGRSFCHDFNP